MTKDESLNHFFFFCVSEKKLKLENGNVQLKRLPHKPLY